MTVTQNEDKTLLEFSNVISYLVKCRFPDLDLIELDIRDYGQKQAEVNAFIKELNGYSLKELLPQYYNERQKEELLLASLSIRDDELRFFNQPNVRADFWHYCKMLTWTKEQAVALSFGKDPKKVNWTILEEYQDCPPLNELPSKSHFIKCYEKIRELVLSDQELNETASPKTFLDWFNRQEIQVQPELQRMAISLGIIDAAQYDWIKNILDLNSNTNVACRLSFEVCFPNFP